MSVIAITGRLPEISIAELEALYGARALQRLGDHVLVDAPVDFSRLGGTVKLATHIATVDTTNPQKAFDYCRKALPVYVESFPEGKIKLGVSLYGVSMPLHKQNANVLSLKKAIKRIGRSVRAVPNTEPALSSAQTFHNALTSGVGLELVFVAHNKKTYIGHVTHVQDIDSYTLRDRGRPKRDPFVGMLPPKLAQTIINLAIGTSHSEDGASQSTTSVPAAKDSADRRQSGQPNATAEPQAPRKVLSEAVGSGVLTVSAHINASHIVLDPFCGTGVILQEAALMGYGVYGTDVSEKMVRFSRDNLNWALETFGLHVERQLEIADATTHTWRQPISAVACEGFLGQPLGGQHPSPERLSEIIHECNGIMRDFLKNIHNQLQPGTRLCIAAPAWFVDETYHHLPVLEEFSSLGYDRVQSKHVDTTQLIYSREDQITHRELLVLQCE